jgi:MATE family multidrug resistance protein
VAARVLDLLGACCFGFSDAANIRVGAAIGSGERHRVRFIGLVAVQLSFGVSGLFAAVIVAAPTAVASLVLGCTDARGVAAAAALFPLVALLLVLESVQSALGGALSGMRDARGPLMIAGFGAWGMGLPVGVGLAWMTDVPAMGLWIGLLLGGCVTTALYAVRFYQKLVS